MEYRKLGASGFMVPALSFGTLTFGGRGPVAEALGAVGLDQARRLVNLCLDAGVTMFDTANSYSSGESERILGEAVKGRRHEVIISTKASFRVGDGPNDVGSSRYHLIAACEASLKRLGTDHIDVYYVHGFDALTPVEETLSTLDVLVRSGKVRYVGYSNFSGWHAMKSLATADRQGWPRYVAQQIYYSLIGRDAEHELVPLGLDQGVGSVVWSPLGWGRLTGKFRRGQPADDESRLNGTAHIAQQKSDDYIFAVLDVLETIAAETGSSVPQVAISWLLGRPTVSSVVIGARNERQLADNLAASDLNLTREQLGRLDAASSALLPYPYSHQRRTFADRNPSPF